MNSIDIDEAKRATLDLASQLRAKLGSSYVNPDSLAQVDEIIFLYLISDDISDLPTRVSCFKEQIDQHQPKKGLLSFKSVCLKEAASMFVSESTKRLNALNGVTLQEPKPSQPSAKSSGLSERVKHDIRLQKIIQDYKAKTKSKVINNHTQLQKIIQEHMTKNKNVPTLEEMKVHARSQREACNQSKPTVEEIRKRIAAQRKTKISPFR